MNIVLPVPGRALVPEAGSVVEAVRVNLAEEGARYNRDHLLNSALLSKELRVRNWRPGDRFWPAHTKSAKKIKELLQEHHVTGVAQNLAGRSLRGPNRVGAGIRGARLPHEAKESRPRDSDSRNTFGGGLIGFRFRSKKQEARHYMNTTSRTERCVTVIPAEQIQKRVREMARQISDDYQGKTIHALALLENSFMFMADLVRALEVPVICQFMKPRYRKQDAAALARLWRSFSATSPTSKASTCCWSKAWCTPASPPSS